MLPTRQELVTAIQNADAAGDIEAARELTKLFQTGQYKGGRDVTKQLQMEVESQIPTDQQITEESLEPGFFETETGQVTGGIAGGIAGAKKGFELGGPTPTGRAVGTILGGAFGAFFGGATGEAAQQIYLSITDNPLAAQNWEETAQKMLESGAEEAMYDAFGSIAFKTIGAGWRMIRPKEIDEIAEVQRIMDEFGGTLTAAQRTDNKFVQTIEGLTRASWGGGRLRKIDQINDEAIKRYADDYINAFTDTANKELTADGVGRLFVNTIEDGIQIHKGIANDMYSQLDDLYIELVKKKKISKKTPLGILGPEGKMLHKTTTEVVEQAVKPVSTKGLKDVVQKVIKIQDELKGATFGDYGKSVIDAVSKFDDGLSFKAAQELRSSLLSDLRLLKSQVGESKSGPIFQQLVDQLEIAMQKGAKATGNEAYYKQWEAANKFYKTGKEKINTEFIQKLLKQNPEKIGETVFATGNITQIRNAKRALAKAATYSKKTPNPINFSDTWKRMQGGYLNDILGKAKDPTSNQLSIPKLRSFLKKNTKEGRTFNNAFTSQQRKEIKKFINTLEKVQARPKAAGDFMITVGQAGLVLGGFGFSQYLATGELPVGDYATFIITPFIMAKALTNPKLAALISKGMNTKAYGAQSGAVFAKIVAALQELEPFAQEQTDGK